MGIMPMRKLISILLLMFISLPYSKLETLYCSDKVINSDSQYQLAAKNIADKIGTLPSKSVLIINSEPKFRIADFVRNEIENRGMEAHVLQLSTKMESTNESIADFVNKVTSKWGLIFLLHPVHTHFLIETVGRPDLGLKIAEDHLFCDWLIPEASLIRTYAIDMDELQEFRSNLLQVVKDATEIRITSEAGTDVTLFPREWKTTDGEIFTAPQEKLTKGTIFVDGCAYGGPPKNPFTLKIEAGRVVNVNELSSEDKQQKWVRKDLSRDGNACVLAELGIGINPGAKCDENVMESEQARGTVHFGFGDNIGFGGENQSSYHIDYVILKPTIEIDRRIICKDGKYNF